MANEQRVGQATDGGSRLREVVEAIRFAMVTTVDRHGTLHSRPMTTQRTDADGTLWFLAASTSPLVLQLREQPALLVTYGCTRLRRYVSISGVATLLRCPRTAGALWDDSVAAQFPEGPSDPDVVVVKVEVDTAEYWDPVPAPIAFPKFIEAVRAGDPPRGRRAGRTTLLHAPQAREE